MVELIIKYYFDGVSEKSLNKIYGSKDVKEALYSPEYAALREKYRLIKAKKFEEYHKECGIPMGDGKDD